MTVATWVIFSHRLALAQGQVVQPGSYYHAPHLHPVLHGRQVVLPVSSRFPLDQNPGLTLEQVNPPLDDGYYGQAAQSPEYAMLTGDTRVVSVSAIESAGNET